LSAWGILGTFSGLRDLALGKNSANLNWIGVLFVLLMVFAWIALFVMSYAWVKDRRTSRIWPISGTVAGVICVVTLFPISILFAFPGIFLAFSLVKFHLKR
jgi:hypothetical protein